MWWDCLGQAAQLFCTPVCVGGFPGRSVGGRKEVKNGVCACGVSGQQQHLSQHTESVQQLHIHTSG